ncbi:MAG: metallophosphoesterase [Bacillota bacterium]|nr:metallophosphoesterase [Bacillota bacterium]
MIAIALLIFCTLIYLAFAVYLCIYWIKAFKGRFPRCKYVIVPLVTIAASLPIEAAINFIWHFKWAIGDTLAFFGFIVAAFFLYLAMFMVITHLVTVFSAKVLKKNEWYKSSTARMCLVASEILFSLLLCFFGVWGANYTEVEKVDIGSGTTVLKVVALSDIHYGTPGSTVDLDKMSALINAQEPDLVLLAGDVFDNDGESLDNTEFIQAMQEIDSTYGIYAVNGNHEYYENNLAEIRSYYKNSGVTLLVDETVEVGGLLRIAGRDDIGYLKETGIQRQSIDDILKGSDETLPLIVLDHQPQNFRETQAQGSFLQISGHTHNGQLWPGNILVGLIYKLGYNSPSNGINNYDKFTLAISRGYGTWGFPMRSTGSSHIYCFELKDSLFNKK